MHVTCYLCGQSEFSRRPGAVRDDASLEILECSNCGLVVLSSLEHIHAGHYANSGMHGEMLPSIEAWLRDTEQDDQRRFEMLKRSMVNRKVLDFGCGAAGFLLRARELAAEVMGIEPERRIREHWGDTLRIHGDLAGAGGDFDLITAFHVVEHLPDPRASIQELARLLGERGRLVVEVPNSDDALLTLYDNDAFQRFTYWSQHLFLFNASTLRSLALQAGLRVVSIQQFQRYPLCNHLHWLSRNKPGGHVQWPFLDVPNLNEAYASSLAAVGRCDTLIGYFENSTPTKSKN